MRIEIQPQSYSQLLPLLVLAAKFRHRIAQDRYCAQVDRFVGTAFCQPGISITLNRQPQQAPDKRQYARRQFFHRIGLGRAGHQKLLGRLFAHPHAEPLDRFYDLRTPRPFFIEQQIAQSISRQYFLIAGLDRLEHRSNAGFFRKRSEQGLAEAVDGHDPQSATLSVEDAGKKGSGAVPCLRRGRRADRGQITRQLGIVHPHPGGQLAVDPFRHFRSTGLGESQTENMFRIDLFRQQQAENSRGENLRLSGTGGSTEPDMGFRFDRVDLPVHQREDLWFAATHHQMPPPVNVRTIPQAASTGQNPHKAHIPDAAWPSLAPNPLYIDQLLR